MEVDKVTLWYRLDEEEMWKFNHLEDDWANRNKPVSIDSQQTKAWSNSTWFKKLGLKDSKGRVYETGIKL